MWFNFLSKRVLKFSHINKHSASWYRIYKVVYCRAQAIVIRLQWNINIQVKFSKNLQTFQNTLFMLWKRQREWWEFRNFGKSLETRHRSPDSFIGMCCLRRFLAVLRSFFHSCLLYTLSFQTFQPTSLQSSLASSCHLFLGLSLDFLPKFIHV